MTSLFQSLRTSINKGGTVYVIVFKLDADMGELGKIGRRGNNQLQRLMSGLGTDMTTFENTGGQMWNAIVAFYVFLSILSEELYFDGTAFCLRWHLSFCHCWLVRCEEDRQLE
jgi:hypothetical protein